MRPLLREHSLQLPEERNAMSESTALVLRPPMTTALEPSNINEAIRLADIMADGGLVPKHLQGKPADCFLVIETAVRWGMSPFAVAQATSVIGGKLMHEGKLVAAVINARGGLAKRLDYRFEGAGDKLVCFPFATLQGEDKPREIEEGVALANVRTSNDMWRKQPHQQLTYAAARIWARRHMPELMLGVYAPEEFEARAGVVPIDLEVTDAPKAPEATSSPSAESAAPSEQPAASSTATPAQELTGEKVEVWDKRTVSGTAKGGDLKTEWVSLGVRDQRTLRQNAKLHALQGQCGVTDVEWREWLMSRFNKTSSAELSIGEAKIVIDRLEARVKKGWTASEKEARQRRRAEEAGETIASHYAENEAASAGEKT